MLSGGSETISPTAHYTGYVWARGGLSHPSLATSEGRVLFEALRPLLTASRLLGGASLEPYLLARHRAIDVLLERAIESGEVAQVVEVAAGLSPRGWRFATRYGSRITYIEADLPGMAERKRRALETSGTLGEHHRVEVVDALREGGENSLAALAATLDPDRGLAIVTEGLLGYLEWPAVEAIWQRFARTLRGFSAGTYISDLHLGAVQTPQIRAFRVLLSAFVRGRVHLHFDNAREARERLVEAGFARARVRRAAHIVQEAQRREDGQRREDAQRRAGEGPNGAGPPPSGAGSGLAHILEASTT